MAKGSGGKSKDPSMLEEDYFIQKNIKQNKKFLPPKPKKKPAMNYSGKLGIVYKTVPNSNAH
ncbi:MAG: hypothetical protein ABSG90_12670 [Dehalococcoidia bacterium]|jgi:hypothetical protein